MPETRAESRRRAEAIASHQPATPDQHPDAEPQRHRIKASAREFAAKALGKEIRDVIGAFLLKRHQQTNIQVQHGLFYTLIQPNRDGKIAQFDDDFFSEFARFILTGSDTMQHVSEFVRQCAKLDGVDQPDGHGSIMSQDISALAWYVVEYRRFCVVYNGETKGQSLLRITEAVEATEQPPANATSWDRVNGGIQTLNGPQ